MNIRRGKAKFKFYDFIGQWLQFHNQNGKNDVKDQAENNVTTKAQIQARNLYLIKN